MDYKRPTVYAKDYNIFAQHRLNKQIELKRKISEVEFFHILLEVYEKELSKTDDGAAGY